MPFCGGSYWYGYMILGPQPIISRLNRCRHEESRAREAWWGGSEHEKAWNNLVEMADGDRQPVDVSDPKYGNTQSKGCFIGCWVCCILTASWHNYHKLLLKNSWINFLGKSLNLMDRVVFLEKRHSKTDPRPIFYLPETKSKGSEFDLYFFSWKAVQLRGVEFQGGYKYLQPFLLGPFEGLVHRCIP